MDFAVVLKAGFMGFALSLGVLLLVFYVAGIVLKTSDKYFLRVFILACIVSFIAVYAYLHYKIRVSVVEQAQFFLVGCIGGWLGGILFGATNLRKFFKRTLR
ncbi:MAG: hypothetical protein RDU20_13080 [Desulfomonilaceae bacterium]|nr:hypothetical protein [Desulfomonilaceae bacterium]